MVTYWIIRWRFMAVCISSKQDVFWISFFTCMPDTQTILVMELSVLSLNVISCQFQWSCLLSLYRALIGLKSKKECIVYRKVLASLYDPSWVNRIKLFNPQQTVSCNFEFSQWIIHYRTVQPLLQYFNWSVLSYR